MHGPQQNSGDHSSVTVSILLDKLMSINLYRQNTPNKLNCNVLACAHANGNGTGFHLEGWQRRHLPSLKTFYPPLEYQQLITLNFIINPGSLTILISQYIAIAAPPLEKNLWMKESLRNGKWGSMNTEWNEKVATVLISTTLNAAYVFALALSIGPHVHVGSIPTFSVSVYNIGKSVETKIGW